MQKRDIASNLRRRRRNLAASLAGKPALIRLSWLVFGIAGLVFLQPLGRTAAIAASTGAIFEHRPASTAIELAQETPAEDAPAEDQAAPAEDAPAADQAAPAEEAPAADQAAPAADAPAADPAAPAVDAPAADTAPAAPAANAAPAQDPAAAQADISQEMLSAHNALRAKHCSGPMVWSPALAEGAQKWANRLRDQLQCGLEHSTGRGVGENLSAGNPSAQAAVQGWYDEIKDYNFAQPGFSGATGHFTQVIWQGSTELGCAMAQCANGQFQNVWVCNYGPAGNMQGDFPANVKPLCK